MECAVPMTRMRRQHRFIPVALSTVTFGDAHCKELVEFESLFGGPWSDGVRAIVQISDNGMALDGVGDWSDCGSRHGRRRISVGS